MQVGDWFHSLDHDESCRVVDMDVLWGRANCLVGLLPRRGTTARSLQSRLVPLRSSEVALLERLSFVSTAARIADALGRDDLVAPIEGNVLPLPHQEGVS